ncbi:hypothetical protein MYX07_03100, partial [Patescibacteria group bacterium AH-259-L07]|nr:hypothetical protein [Patescibacteria group bacterium AH-259-L07]
MNQETKTCRNCQSEFIIEPEDFDFYNKINVPSPTFCPACRLQRRLAWRNDRTLYKRKCSLCKEEIIAMYSSEVAFPVYCRSCWYSDKWGGLEYGQGYNFSLSFLEQFKKLMHTVPRLALQVDNCVNCDYTNQIVDSKNCYLVSSASDNEDCMYSHRILNSKNLVDCFLLLKSENCYESIECWDCSQLIFSENAADNFNLLFCYDARGSQNCFMSSNLRLASYHFYNQKLSSQEFKKRMKQIDTGSYKNIQHYRKEFDGLLQKNIHRYSNFKNVVNSVGDSFSNAKNCYYFFNGADAENCRYCLFVNDAKDSVDINNGCCTMELNYEVCTTGVKAYNIKFSVDTWPEARNISYSDCCRNGSHDLFGCISLRKKSYCILNKQYNRQEYEKLREKIIRHMNDMPYTDKKNRIYEYGEFFPAELSPFAYNESVAQEYFPLSQEQAIQQNYGWRKIDKPRYQPTIETDALPDHIKDVNDDILDQIITCAHKGRCNDQCTTAFKIISDELNFYRRMNLPLPRLCPNCRHYERFKRRKPIKLWRRQCMCDYKVYKNTREHKHRPKGRC